MTAITFWTVVALCGVVGWSAFAFVTIREAEQLCADVQRRMRALGWL